MKMPKKPTKTKNEKTSKGKGEAYDPFKHGVSVSALSMWLTCREAARLKYVCGVKPKIESKAFLAGGTMASLHEQYYKALTSGATYATPVEAAEAALAHSEQILADAIAAGKQSAMDEIEAQLSHAEVLLPRYIAHWWDEDTSVEWTDAEREFSVPVPGTGTSLYGFMDGNFNRRGKPWIFESKYKARWSENFITALPQDLQVNGYIFAERESGRDPAGCCYNLTRKPQIRQKAKESRKEFLDRLAEDIDSRPDFYFERVDISLTKKEKDFASDRITYLVRNFLEWWQLAKQNSAAIGSKDMGMNTGQCDGKYGYCQYMPLCSGGDTSGYKIKGK